jgi:hypothetical protein
MYLRSLAQYDILTLLVCRSMVSQDMRVTADPFTSEEGA